MSWIFTNYGTEVAPYSQQILAPEPVIQEPSLWMLAKDWVTSMTIIAHGMAQTTLNMAGVWGSNLCDLWPWLIFLTQILCGIAMLKLAVYALHTLEELATFVFKFVSAVGYFMSLVGHIQSNQRLQVQVNHVELPFDNQARKAV